MEKKQEPENAFGGHFFPEGDSLSSRDSTSSLSAEVEFFESTEPGKIGGFTGVKNAKIRKMFQRVKVEADLIRITMIAGLVYIGLLCGTAQGKKEGKDTRTEDFYVFLKIRGLFQRSEYGEYKNKDEGRKFEDEFVRLHWSSIHCLAGISHGELNDILQSARSSVDAHVKSNENANNINAYEIQHMMWNGQAHAVNLSGAPGTFPSSTPPAFAYHPTQHQHFSHAVASGWGMPNSVPSAAQPWMGWWAGNTSIPGQYVQAVPGYGGHYGGHYGYNGANCNSFFQAQALRTQQHWHPVA